jgi:hypothetical protein
MIYFTLTGKNRGQENEAKTSSVNRGQENESETSSANRGQENEAETSSANQKIPFPLIHITVIL